MLQPGFEPRQSDCAIGKAGSAAPASIKDPGCSLPREWRPGSWVPKAGKQLKTEQQAERGEEKEEEASWLLFCFGHTHTLLISNDGKGNTHRGPLTA